MKKETDIDSIGAAIALSSVSTVEADASGIVDEDLNSGDRSTGEDDVEPDVQALLADAGNLPTSSRITKKAKLDAAQIADAADRFDFNYKKSPDIDDQLVYTAASDAMADLTDQLHKLKDIAAE